jgi:hypothetical protein
VLDEPTTETLRPSLLGIKKMLDEPTTETLCPLLLGIDLYFTLNHGSLPTPSTPLQETSKFQFEIDFKTETKPKCLPLPFSL